MSPVASLATQPTKWLKISYNNTFLFFDFPYDPAIRKKWISQCHRKNFEPTKYSRVCSLHFVLDDIVVKSKCSKLLPSAWPRLHPQLDSRFENPKLSIRATKSSSSSTRPQNQNDIIQSRNITLLSLDQVSSYNDFCSKLRDTTLPSDFVTVINDSTCSFLLIQDITTNPICQASVLVSNDFSLYLFTNRTKVPVHCGNHLLAEKGKISSVTEIAFIKSITKFEVSANFAIEVAANLLESIACDSEEHERLAICIKVLFCKS